MFLRMGALLCLEWEDLCELLDVLLRAACEACCTAAAASAGPLRLSWLIPSSSYASSSWASSLALPTDVMPRVLLSARDPSAPPGGLRLRDRLCVPAPLRPLPGVAASVSSRCKSAAAVMTLLASREAVEDISLGLDVRIEGVPVPSMLLSSAGDP